MINQTAIPGLDEELLTLTWESIESTREIVGTFETRLEPGRKLIASAFGTTLEQALFIRRLDGDALPDNYQGQSEAFRRVRASPTSQWSSWQRASQQ